MGQPVVHFEVVGKDGEGLRNYYSELFGWEFGEPRWRRRRASAGPG
jgi:predicted enzyme related to lactoylglutathione lyase